MDFNIHRFQNLWISTSDNFCICGGSRNETSPDTSVFCIPGQNLYLIFCRHFTRCYNDVAIFNVNMSLIHLMRWVNSKEETFLVKFRFITGYSNAILKLQCMAHTVPVPCKAGDVLFIISTNACLLSGIIEGVRDYVLKSHPEERMYVWETVAVMEKYWKNNSHPEEIQRQIQDCPWLQWRKKDKELKGGKPPAIHQSHLKLKNLLVDYTFYTRMIANCCLGA